jgi:hypothetical protein
MKESSRQNIKRIYMERRVRKDAQHDRKCRDGEVDSIREQRQNGEVIGEFVVGVPIVTAVSFVLVSKDLFKFVPVLLLVRWADLAVPRFVAQPADERDYKLWQDRVSECRIETVLLDVLRGDNLGESPE